MTYFPFPTGQSRRITLILYHISPFHCCIGYHVCNVPNNGSCRRQVGPLETECKESEKLFELLVVFDLLLYPCISPLGCILGNCPLALILVESQNKSR